MKRGCIDNPLKKADFWHFIQKFYLFLTDTPKSQHALGAILLIGTMTTGLLACKKPAVTKHAAHQQYTIHTTTLKRTLHFSGTIQPLKEKSITSPVNAVIESMNFHYGQLVDEDQVVFVLNSQELQRDYNETLTEYLKAKDSYDMTINKFTGTVELWNAGLLSKNSYLNEKSALNTSRLALIQASRKLSELLEKMDDGPNENLSNLSFEEFDKVRLALNSKHNLIHLKASVSGVLLYPPKEGGTHVGRLGVGSAVKAGQVLGLVGNLNGIRVEIDIPEVDIADVKIGMPATIHGLAFGKQTLRGELVAINAEASTGTNTGLPTFTAIVEVHELSPQQQIWVKVGMSAAIEVTLRRSNKMLIPIDAISQEKGKSIVYAVNANGQLAKRLVTTGPVTGNKVVIEAGLQVGDVVQYDKFN